MGDPPPSEGPSLAAVAPIVETRILVDTVEISLAVVRTTWLDEVTQTTGA